MFQFRLVAIGPRGMEATNFDVTENSQEEFEAAMAKQGWTLRGYEQRAVLRAELQGRPKFAELCGPMYDGKNEMGRPIIRYETSAAYDRLSA